MAAKQLIFSEDARRRLSRGMETLAVAVATTLGPKDVMSPWIRNSAPQRSPMMV